MISCLKNTILALVRLGIGNRATVSLPDNIDWNVIEALAKQQGLFGVVVDGVLCHLDSTNDADLLPLTTKLRWMGEVQLEENRFRYQWNTACKMAQLFHENDIRSYVLKGMVVSECYPVPKHRVGSDFDCFPLPEKGGFDAWEKANQLIAETGCEVEKVFYKNSTFRFPGLMVENHRYMVPFRGNKTLQKLEVLLQGMMRNSMNHLLTDSKNGQYEVSRFEGSELWRPPVMVSALFLIEHAYSHFLHEGLTWRHVLDWVMFSHKHEVDIDWVALNAQIDEFGFRKFYDVFIRLGKYLLGEIQNNCLTVQEKRMLDDVWRPLDLHESVRGFKGKLALAGNTWRARWKYRYFTEITWFTALWIQVKGFLFEKTPKLY